MKTTGNNDVIIKGTSFSLFYLLPGSLFFTAVFLLILGSVLKGVSVNSIIFLISIIVEIGIVYYWVKAKKTVLFRDKIVVSNWITNKQIFAIHLQDVSSVNLKNVFRGGTNILIKDKQNKIFKTNISGLSSPNLDDIQSAFRSIGFEKIIVE